LKRRCTSSLNYLRNTGSQGHLCDDDTRVRLGWFCNVLRISDVTVTPVFLLKMDGNSGSTFHRRKAKALEEFYTTVEATLCQRNQKSAISVPEMILVVKVAVLDDSLSLDR
jgi:hypothetical protein